jgi:uncharacterized protein (TIGR00730 family)
VSAEGEAPAARAASSGGPDPSPLAIVPEATGTVPAPDPETIESALEALAGTRQLSRTQANLLRSMLASLWAMAREGTSAGDLKIADAALAEMTEAFRVFSPYRSVRKMTMFGSARTRPADPIYLLARDLAAHLAGAGWMVVTGAGPGIMAAGIEGAGAQQSFGVNIRLPHEQGANPFIAQDPKLVEMRYFFTRKLMLIKESNGYAVLPGGFGTLDECYELLTLLQTGKAEPAPVVLVETPGGSYWSAFRELVESLADGPGYISADDLSLFRVVTTVDDAAREVLDFYANYHSCRWVGDLLVLRVQVAPNRQELAELNAEFKDIVASGSIRLASPFPPERADNDQLHLQRVVLRFDRLHYGRLRQLIDALNRCTG